jgi:ribosome-associated toxin RatA of RatAB toxin-antitoxin module
LASSETTVVQPRTALFGAGVRRQTIEQTMERLPQGARRLAAQLRTPLSVELLWKVLTDYENLSTFIPNLARSAVLAKTGNRVHLAQVGSQQLLGLKFSAQVELELTEHLADGLLQFRMVKGDFRRFEGIWRLQALPDGTSLLYELTVQGCLGMPVGLIEQRLRADLAANLLAVEQEALRRDPPR